MDEPPRAVTAAAARAARESPIESPEAAGAGRAARDEERAAHWGERRAARERDRSASPPPSLPCEQQADGEQPSPSLGPAPAPAPGPTLPPLVDVPPTDAPASVPVAAAPDGADAGAPALCAAVHRAGGVVEHVRLTVASTKRASRAARPCEPAAAVRVTCQAHVRALEAALKAEGRSKLTGTDGAGGKVRAAAAVTRPVA